MDPLLIAVVIGLVLLGGTAWVLLSRARTETPATTRPMRREGLAEALAATRKTLLGKLRGDIDDHYWERAEEALIAADLGAAVAADLVAEARARKPDDDDAATKALQAGLSERLARPDRGLSLGGTPAVIVVVGVNGVGKTTSIAKLAHRLGAEGRKVLLGAADTFRAGAEQQLRVWAERLGTELVSGHQGADPASVAFDTVSAAKARGYDAVIIDTAGRLHSEANLMAELEKVVRVLTRDGGAVDEVLLVLDANTGRNGVAQAEEFARAVPLTGVIMTKLDGTAKGGVIVAVESTIDVPVKLVGVGETLDAMVPFDSSDFVAGLIGDQQ